MDNIPALPPEANCLFSIHSYQGEYTSLTYLAAIPSDTPEGRENWEQITTLRAEELQRY